MTDHWFFPPEPSKEEREIAFASLSHIYSLFQDPVDKLIIAMVFELGYPKNMVAEVINRDQQTVSLRIKKIRTTLSIVFRHNIKSENGTLSIVQ